MQRKEITVDLTCFPESFREILTGSSVYDSSCSKEAQVFYIEKAQGFYLKKAPKGSLQKEAAMYSYFHEKDLAPQMIAYETGEWDWMLTARAKGEDCLDPLYLSDPERLCDTTAELLRKLHETDPTNCPIPNRTEIYLARAFENHRQKRYDLALFPDNWGYDTPEAAITELEQNGKYLKTDTLLHGDYCLPNIILDNWQFGSFIDLDAAGVGDKHVDLFWGIWSLQFNLKTDRYRDRFLDVYGREDIEVDCFRTVAAAEVFG